MLIFIYVYESIEDVAVRKGWRKEYGSEDLEVELLEVQPEATRERSRSPRGETCPW